MSQATKQPVEPINSGQTQLPLIFMVDIETEGLLYGAPILSVGVAAWRGGHHAEPIISTEYLPQRREKSSDRIRPETLKWWFESRDRMDIYSSLNARRRDKTLSSPSSLSRELAQFQLVAIEAYNEDIPGNQAPASASNVEWWCKGPHFDAAHLEVYLHPYPPPWRFYQLRDYRTYLKEFNDGIEPVPADPKSKHSAEDDAVNQLRNLIAIKIHFDSIQRSYAEYAASQLTDTSPELYPGASNATD